MPTERSVAVFAPMMSAHAAFWMIVQSVDRALLHLRAATGIHDHVWQGADFQSAVLGDKQHVQRVHPGGTTAGIICRVLKRIKMKSLCEGNQGNSAICILVLSGC